MSGDVASGLLLLEKATAFLRDGDFADWHEAYVAAGKKAQETGNADWAAIRDLIVVATHGAPHELSYLDEEFRTILTRGRES